MKDFIGFPKIARLYKGDIVITEKIDGTNAQIYIERYAATDAFEPVAGAICVDTDEFNYLVWAGSRSRWLQYGADNFGFSAWVQQNARDLAVGLGEGQHFGEWWGRGIQRGYSKTSRFFSLFNTGRWYDSAVSREPVEGQEAIPFVEGLSVVPVLYRGPWFGRPADPVAESMRRLEYAGSTLDPDTEAEGVVVFHEASQYYFKAPFKEIPKDV